MSKSLRVYLAILAALSLFTGAARSQHLSLLFEQNRGQAPERVRFLARPHGYRVDFTDDGAELHLEAGLIQIQFLGSRHAMPQGHARLDGLVRYVGNDSDRNINQVPTFASVRYDGLYPGIDLAFYGRGGQPESTFLVSPETKPESIGLRISGADGIDVDGDGNLKVQVGMATFRVNLPSAFQMPGRRRQTVDIRYEISRVNEIRFRLGEYNPALPLSICLRQVQF